MKKLIAIMMAALLAMSIMACGGSSSGKTDTAAEPAKEEVTEEAAAEADAAATEDAQAEAQTDAAADAAADTAAETAAGAYVELVPVMTYEEYAAAELDSPVTVETYVQAKQSWWENKATLYTQDENGAYFVYDMPISQEDYDKLVPGQKIKISGYKAEWSGEVEIVDATFEIEDGNFIAEPLDVTDKLGTDELADYQNQFVSFTDLTVKSMQDQDGQEVTYLYNWDGSGAEGDDLYFSVGKGEDTYTFTVESYLCGADSDVYKAVKELKAGDVVDLQGFLYWYEGANPHITNVTVK